MMSKNRLDYETIGGSLSPEITFAQLVEYLRLAEEDARSLARARKIASDDSTAFQWLAIANNFAKTQALIATLTKGKTKSSVGYDRTN